MERNLSNLIKLLRSQVKQAVITNNDIQASILATITNIDNGLKKLIAKYEVDTDAIESKLQEMTDNDILEIMEENALAQKLQIGYNDNQLQRVEQSTSNSTTVKNHGDTQTSSNSGSHDDHRLQKPNTNAKEKICQHNTDEKSNTVGDVHNTTIANSDIDQFVYQVDEYSFNIKHTALIMIDFQRDFLLPGGFGELLGNNVQLLHSAIGPAKNILSKARECGIKIIHTLESHLDDLSDVHKSKLQINSKYKIGDKGPMGKIMIRNEYGNNIIDSLLPLKNEKIIYKPGKGSFYNTDLFDYLIKNNITHLLFTGVTTEVCVFSTMCEARDRGFYCLLLTDATASYFPKFKNNIQHMIVAQNHIVGWTATCQQLIKCLNQNNNNINGTKNLVDHDHDEVEVDLEVKRQKIEKKSQQEQG